MQKRKRGCLLFLVLVLSIIFGASLIEILKPPREKYQAIDFENESTWRRDFFLEYQMAISQEIDWIKDAETVALRVAGFPNEDKSSPDRVDKEVSEDGMVIITILKEAMDDSIARIETRVELKKDGEVWNIVWAGWRQQCARDAFLIGWTTSYCP